jgi:hypothetical protein
MLPTISTHRPLTRLLPFLAAIAFLLLPAVVVTLLLRVGILPAVVALLLLRAGVIPAAVAAAVTAPIPPVAVAAAVIPAAVVSKGDLMP